MNHPTGYSLLCLLHSVTIPIHEIPIPYRTYLNSTSLKQRTELTREFTSELTTKRLQFDRDLEWYLSLRGIRVEMLCCALCYAAVWYSHPQRCSIPRWVFQAVFRRTSDFGLYGKRPTSTEYCIVLTKNTLTRASLSLSKLCDEASSPRRVECTTKAGKQAREENSVSLSTCLPACLPSFRFD